MRHLHKIISIISILVFGFYPLLVWGSLNTKSIDLERDNSQYAYITDAAQTGLDVTQNISVEAWIKKESDTGSPLIIVGKGTSDPGLWRFYEFNNHLQFRWWNDAGKGCGYITDNHVIANTAQWYHVAATVDITNKVIVMYVDGSSVAVTKDLDEASSGGSGNSTGKFGVGATNLDGTPAWFFDGLVDEVRVWSDIRTSTEISDNYNKQLVGNEANLVGYWQFNNDYLDLTSNNNDLTVVNSPAFSTDVPFPGTADAQPKPLEDVIIFE